MTREHHAFVWRREKVIAIATGVLWYIYRRGAVLSGPSIRPGELWLECEQRLKTWMDANVGGIR